MPLSLPATNVQGCPVTAALRFRLVPPGPVTNTRNVLPAFAVVKFTNASRMQQLCRNTDDALIVAPPPTGTKLTLVTAGVPSGKQKQAPDIRMSCDTAQFTLPDGIAENTTGALVPSANTQLVTLVNGPQKLLSPPVNVVTSVRIPVPPQHTDGQLLLNSTGAASVPVIRLQLTGVTLVNATIGTPAVGTPAPVTSHATVAAVVTTLPGRLSGMPVSSENPAQIVVVSFGKNPHPIMFNGTLQIELMIPVVVGVVTNVPGTTARHMSCGTQLMPLKHIR